MRIAILDFGTNTFNLLIAEKQDRDFRILFSGKQPVKLGRGGIQRNRILPDAFERGFVAIQNHVETIEQYGVDEIRAFATSAIRNASNGGEFTDEVKRRFDIRVRVISGDREADLIYKGVRRALPFEEKVMILDIGGGSNEFIICDREKILWKQSFELGMARILELFDLSDPIHMEEVKALEAFYREGLRPLYQAVDLERPHILAGASGSFDTFCSLMKESGVELPSGEHGRELPMEEYDQLHRRLLHSTLEERKMMPGMEPVRVEMIVPASIFVSFVIREFQIRQLLQSDFALKEGVISELLGI